MKKLEAIKKIRFVVTDYCNYQCKFCHNEGGKTKNTKMLALEHVVTITKVAKNLGIEKITITGGEPLTNQDTIDMLKNIKLIYPSVSLGITSNGMLFNEEKLEAAKKYIDRIRLNCQSFDNEIFRKISGKAPNVDRLKRIILELKKNSKINICLNYVFTKLNKNSLKDLVVFATANNLDMKVLEYMILDKELYENINEAKTILSSLKPLKIEKDYQDDDIYTFRYSSSRIRLCYSFCNKLKCSSCRECGELRVTPELTFKHCFKDNVKEVNIAKELIKKDYEAIKNIIIALDKIKGKVIVKN